MKEIKSKGEMISDAKAMMFAVTVAIIAGGVSWILYKKPSWSLYTAINQTSPQRC
jgi:hypothetical protein